MDNEKFPVGQEDEATLQGYDVNGRELLNKHGAGHLADRELSIVHGDKVITGTVAMAIGGLCSEFTTFAKCMLEVGGPEILAKSIEKYVEKSEQKKKN